MLLLQLLQQPNQLFKMARIHLYVQQIAFAVEELVRRETVDVKVPLDGCLLLCGQVVVRYVIAAHVILLDDVLPRFLRTVVGKIKELDVVVLQSGILLGGVGEGFLAGAAPCAPDVEQDEPAPVRFKDFLLCTFNQNKKSLIFGLENYYEKNVNICANF